MSPDEARRRFASARVARLATADVSGRPHVVPFVFALRDDTVYSVVDHKPKRTTSLRRLANIAENPEVAMLPDHYDNRNWEQLWWARGEGSARAMETGSIEAAEAMRLLTDRYPQYQDDPPPGPLVAIDVRRWSGWAAAERLGLR